MLTSSVLLASGAKAPDIRNNILNLTARKIHVRHSRMRIREEGLEAAGGQFHPRDRGKTRHIGDGTRLLGRDEMAGSAPALRDNLTFGRIGGERVKRGCNQRRKAKREAKELSPQNPSAIAIESLNKELAALLCESNGFEKRRLPAACFSFYKLGWT